MIDYIKIGKAIEYYKSEGFKYIEVPWVADEDIIKTTLPIDRDVIKCQLGNLVGSAEQSFLQLVKNKKLQLDGYHRYMACTPCFRDENNDFLHKSYFMKVELFIPTMVNDETLDKVVNICLKFFKKYISCKVIETEEGFDIVTEDNVELGSYGIRNDGNISWIYATGLAEPRLTSQIPTTSTYFSGKVI